MRDYYSEFIAKKIILRGRLGNNLFQIAFADYLQSIFGLKIILVYQNFSNNQVEKDLFEICESMRLKIILENLHLPLIRSFRSSTSRLKMNTLNIMKDPKRIPTFPEILENRTFIGYFQNSNIVVSNLNFLTKLEDAVASKTSLETKFFEQPFNLIHVRGGDYLESQHSQFGNLSFEYYKELKPFLNDYPTYILTDDVNHAKQILSDCELEANILSPKQYNPYHGLNLARLAKNFISSNSTYSWWCAAINSRNGGSSFLPFPFFKELDPERGLSLCNLEYCKYIDSKWA